MNDDDYEFDTAENSRLSALFKQEYGDGDSNLKYKAPKQPDKSQNAVSSINSKTFYKFIKLYQMSNEKLYGKYIIAIVNSKQGIPEILIYQTKNNILIRHQVHEKSLYSFNKITLILYENEPFKLQFETGKDLLEFTREYAKNGGTIEIFPDRQLVNNSSDNGNLQFELGGEIKTGGLTDDSQGIKDEKSVIVTRLEKMGVPLLPAFPKVKSQEENTSIIKDNEVIHMNSSNNDETVKIVSTVTAEDNIMKNKEQNSKSVITKDQSDLLTSLLISNQTNSSQLTEAILLFTSKLKEINPSEKPDRKNEIEKLKSKVKSLELRAENLQSELDKCWKKKNESSYAEPSCKEIETCDIACQTNDSGISKENNFKSFLIDILEIMKSFPLTTKEIERIKKLKDETQNEELQKSLEPYFDAFEKKCSVGSQSKEETRNEFFTQLKKIMYDMYQNVYTSVDHDDARSLLARQVKLASVEILKAYDNSDNPEKL